MSIMRNWSVAAVVVVAGLPLCAIGQDQPSSPAASEQKSPATDWIKANAVQFKTPEAGNGFDDLAGLDAIVGEARVVSLGEPTHGTREAFQMKHRLLEYLVEKKGFSIFSIEANVPESYALNEYIVDGKGDPKKLITGMYFWTWRTEEVLAMVEWMRAWNVKHPEKPVMFTGFDMQTPDVAAGIASKFAKEHAPALADQVEAACKAVVSLNRQKMTGGKSAEDWTSATGTLPIDAVKGKTVKLAAWARTKDVGDHVAIWVRADSAGTPAGFATTQDKAVKGTTPWTKYEVELKVPPNADNVNFGFILGGDGTAWFDDIEVAIDGVKYEDVAKFSFDFENDAVRYLNSGSPLYAVTRSETEPHGGKKCLEIKRVAAVAVPADPMAVRANVEAALAKMVTARMGLARKTTERDADWAIQNLRVVAQCAKMLSGENGYNMRDECMAENVRWILDQNPGKKVVLWAHNGHVAKAEYMSMKSMGTHLSATLAKEMVVFGFATGAGKYTAMPMGGGSLGHDFPLQKPSKNSIERVLTESGIANAILDIRGAKADESATAWAATARPMRSIGAMATLQQFYSCVPNAMFDVIVWQRDTTASKTLAE